MLSTHALSWRADSFALFTLLLANHSQTIRRQQYEYFGELCNCDQLACNSEQCSLGKWYVKEFFRIEPQTPNEQAWRKETASELMASCSPAAASWTHCQSVLAILLPLHSVKTTDARASSDLVEFNMIRIVRSFEIINRGTRPDKKRIARGNLLLHYLLLLH